MTLRSPEWAGPGDANDDGKVDVTDLGILASNFRLATTSGFDAGDFNRDGVVNVTDLGQLLFKNLNPNY